MLAAVHLARKQLGLDEAAYRDVVRRVTGVDSAGAAEPAKLRALIEEFRRLGFRTVDRRVSPKPHVRKIHALWADLRPHLTRGDGVHSDAALRAFVRRQTGVASPEWLDGPQANKVIEGLKAWLTRARAARKQTG